MTAPQNLCVVEYLYVQQKDFKVPLENQNLTHWKWTLDYIL